jgi:hypothetical protein
MNLAGFDHFDFAVTGAAAAVQPNWLQLLQ